VDVVVGGVVRKTGYNNGEPRVLCVVFGHGVGLDWEEFQSIYVIRETKLRSMRLRPVKHSRSAVK
jgi:hypothetical protein